MSEPKLNISLSPQGSDCLQSERMMTMYVQNSFQVENEIVPFYKFTYKKNIQMLLNRKEYWKKRNNRLPNGKFLMEYINEVTFSQINFKNDKRPIFEKAMMVFIHHFTDNRRHDLDNYVYKPIVDSVRLTKIIPDDNYKHLSFSYFGKKCNEEYIEVFIVPIQYYLDFCQQRLKYLFVTNSNSNINLYKDVYKYNVIPKRNNNLL